MGISYNPPGLNSFDPANPGTIGGTTPSDGSFLQLEASVVKVAGTQVLTNQQAAITGPSVNTVNTGTDTIDAADLNLKMSQLNDNILLILVPMRTHGLIAT